jgi:hypothetical protein
MLSTSEVGPILALIAPSPLYICTNQETGKKGSLEARLSSCF